MSHLTPDGGTRSPPSRPSVPCPVVPHPLGSQALLTPEIEFRRMQLAELEAELVAACEEAALGTRQPAEIHARRDSWDRTTWDRYLAAAMRLEATYGPHMRQLHREIGQLERLMTLLRVA